MAIAKNQAELRKQMKAIRAYVSFNYDLTKPISASAGRKIARYYEEFERLTARPNKVYRPRNKRRLKPAQEFAQHPGGFGDFKVAFVPGIKDTRLHFTKDNRVYTKTAHIRAENIQVDPLKIALDPRGETLKAIARHPKAKRYQIKAGEFQVPASYSASQLPGAVERLVSRYSPGGEKYKERKVGEVVTSSNNVNQWLGGFTAYYFDNQAGADDFGKVQAARAEAKAKLQKERKNKKRRK